MQKAYIRIFICKRHKHEELEGNVLAFDEEIDRTKLEHFRKGTDLVFDGEAESWLKFFGDFCA